MTADTTIPDTRSRLLHTALKLFSKHGTEGTSLQMMADALGVTKAAVYYHFKTKDEIVEAIVGPPVRELNQVLGEALTKRSRSAQIGHALQGLVEAIVRHRALFGLVNSDPGIRRVAETTAEAANVASVSAKMQAILAGSAPNLADTLTVHVVFAGLCMVGGEPAYADIADDTLRQQLLDVGKSLLGRPRH